MRSLKQRLLAGGAYVLVGKVITASSTLITASLLSRLLSEDEVGDFGLAYGLVTAGAILAQLGLHQAAVRLVAEAMGRNNLDRARAVTRFVYRYGALGAIAVAMILGLGGGRWLSERLWQSPALAGAMGLIAGWTLIQSLQILTSEVFRGYQDLKLATLFGGVITGVATVTMLGSMWWLNGHAILRQVVLVNLLAGALSLVFALIAMQRKVRPLEGTEVVSNATVLGISLPLWANGVTAYLLMQSDVFILGAFLPREQVGIYFLAVRLVAMVSLSLILVNLVAPPFIAELYSKGEKQRLQRVLRSTATFAGVPAFGVLIAFVFFGAPILGLVYAEEYRAGATVLALLSVGKLVNVWTGSCGVVLSMTGHQTRLMRITLVTSVLTVGGSFLVVRSYGTVGVAAVVCGGTILQNLWMWLSARYCTGMWTHASLPSRRDLQALLGRAA